MYYIFTFLGEFGYELLNWQGVIRKFSRTISPSDKIICCSRGKLYPLYETASIYIDISEVEIFKKSVASCYFALPPFPHPDHRQKFHPRLILTWDLIFDWNLKRVLKSFIIQQLRFRLSPLSPKDFVFIFSSDKVELNGCKFGCLRWRCCGPKAPDGNIYELLDLDNNVYKKLEPDLSFRGFIEEKLGWSLEEPFVLCQMRSRTIAIKSKDILPREKLFEFIKALSRKIKVVLLSFNTGRYLDSYSVFDFVDVPNSFHYNCQSFVEQACLIYFAKKCVFFTEGDFGSHIYVPPFLGKDVIAIAPHSVYQVGTTPIEFWNRNVFKFGGQIIPKVSEEVFASGKRIRRFINNEILI
jgi:hypothetical protein